LRAILDVLDQEGDPTSRADLAIELVGSSAKYEDVIERVVYPTLRSIGQDTKELDRAESDRLVIREGLTDLRHRTQHVKPSNVHASDPEGFEDLLDRLVDAVRVQLDHEDKVLFPLLDQLPGTDLADLRNEVEKAVAHASTHPHPPHSTVGRAVRSVMEKLDRSVHDQSTISHPGIDRLHDDLDSSTKQE
jgi:hypothetical protein